MRKNLNTIEFIDALIEADNITKAQVFVLNKIKDQIILLEDELKEAESQVIHLNSLLPNPIKDVK